jgi:hypothetical protein
VPAVHQHFNYLKTSGKEDGIFHSTAGEDDVSISLTAIPAAHETSKTCHLNALT